MPDTSGQGSASTYMRPPWAAKRPARPSFRRRSASRPLPHATHRHCLLQHWRVHLPRHPRRLGPVLERLGQLAHLAVLPVHQHHVRRAQRVQEARRLVVVGVGGERDVVHGQAQGNLGDRWEPVCGWMKSMASLILNQGNTGGKPRERRAAGVPLAWLGEGRGSRGWSSLGLEAWPGCCWCAD